MDDKNNLQYNINNRNPEICLQTNHFKCNNIDNIKNKVLRFWTGLLQTTEFPPSKHTAPDSLDEHLISP